MEDQDIYDIGEEGIPGYVQRLPFTNSIPQE
jgi:hypothetical protein